MSRRPPVTLLLPNRNNGPVLDLVMSRLVQNTTYPDFEVVVVDDGSTDESLSILRRWRDSAAFSAFTLIEREHGGVVEALNAGLGAAAGSSWCSWTETQLRRHGVGASGWSTSSRATGRSGS